MPNKFYSDLSGGVVDDSSSSDIVLPNKAHFTKLENFYIDPATRILRRPGLKDISLGVAGIEGFNIDKIKNFGSKLAVLGNTKALPAQLPTANSEIKINLGQINLDRARLPRTTPPPEFYLGFLKQDAPLLFTKEALPKPIWYFPAGSIGSQAGVDLIAAYYFREEHLVEDSEAFVDSMVFILENNELSAKITHLSFPESLERGTEIAVSSSRLLNLSPSPFGVVRYLLVSNTDAGQVTSSGKTLSQLVAGDCLVFSLLIREPELDLDPGEFQLTFGHGEALSKRMLSDSDAIAVRSTLAVAYSTMNTRYLSTAQRPYALYPAIGSLSPKNSDIHFFLGGQARAEIWTKSNATTNKWAGISFPESTTWTGVHGFALSEKPSQTTVDGDPAYRFVTHLLGNHTVNADAKKMQDIRAGDTIKFKIHDGDGNELYTNG